MEDEEIVVGGRQRREQENEWFPFRDEREAVAMMRVVEKAEILTKQSWSAWKLLLCEAQNDASEESGEGVENTQTARSPLGEVSHNSR